LSWIFCFDTINKNILIKIDRSQRENNKINLKRAKKSYKFFRNKHKEASRKLDKQRKALLKLANKLKKRHPFVSLQIDLILDVRKSKGEKLSEKKLKKFIKRFLKIIYKAGRDYRGSSAKKIIEIGVSGIQLSKILDNLENLIKLDLEKKKLEKYTDKAKKKYARLEKQYDKSKRFRKAEKRKKKSKKKKKTKKCGAMCKDFETYKYCDRLVYNPPCWQHRA